MKKQKIRIGIVGLGYLGKFHYQKYMLNPSVKVTSIVDTAEANFKIIKNNNIFKSKSYRDILDKVEILFIAVGTPLGEDGAADLSYVVSVAKV